MFTPARSLAHCRSRHPRRQKSKNENKKCWTGRVCVRVYPRPVWDAMVYREQKISKRNVSRAQELQKQILAGLKRVWANTKISYATPHIILFKPLHANEVSLSARSPSRWLSQLLGFGIGPKRFASTTWFQCRPKKTHATTCVR